MALRWFDGFDHYASANVEQFYNYYQQNGTAVIETGGRNGTYRIRMTGGSSGNGVRKIVAASGSVVICGCAYQINNATATTLGIFTVYSGSTALFSVVKNASTMTLSVTRGIPSATVIGGPSTYVVPVDQWIYVEVKVTLASGATGSYEVRVNGANVLSATGVQTSPGATTWDGITQGYFPSSADGTSQYFDDYYICDGSGSDNNDFLGDVRVDTVLPQTDAVAAGSNAGLTPSTGTDHGALVDEGGAGVAPNTTDYNGSASVGAKDTYNYPNIATTNGAVLGVMVAPYLFKSDAGARAMRPVVRVGGVDYDGTVVYPGVSALYYPEIYERDPTSTLWTVSSVNAAEFGVKIAA